MINSNVYYVKLDNYKTGKGICQKDKQRRMYNSDFELTDLGSADLLPKFVSLNFGYDVGYGFVEKSPLSGVKLVISKNYSDNDDIFLEDFLYCSFSINNPSADNYDFFIKGKAILEALNKFNKNKMYDVDKIYRVLRSKSRKIEDNHGYSRSQIHNKIYEFPECYRYEYDGTNEDLRCRYQLNEEWKFYRSLLCGCSKETIEEMKSWFFGDELNI